MLHAGLDPSRRKVDVCLVSAEGEFVDEWASPPDAAPLACNRQDRRQGAGHVSARDLVHGVVEVQ
jgi:hypothetical protein